MRAKGSAQERCGIRLIEERRLLGVACKAAPIPTGRRLATPIGAAFSHRPKSGAGPKPRGRAISRPSKRMRSGHRMRACQAASTRGPSRKPRRLGDGGKPDESSASPPPGGRARVAHDDDGGAGRRSAGFGPLQRRPPSRNSAGSSQSDAARGASLFEVRILDAVARAPAGSTDFEISGPRWKAKRRQRLGTAPPGESDTETGTQALTMQSTGQTETHCGESW